jgi:serine/threonine protein phosphatase PrpC
MVWEVILGGEIASSLAVEAVRNYVKNNISSIQLDKDNILEFIGKAMEYANHVVYAKSREDEELQEMGTTLEICLIHNCKAYIGHIGDSRIYRIRNKFIRRLTTDHSYVEKLVRDGTITKAQSYMHPKKNMLTKALGCDEKIEPDVFVKGFLKDDILLMCSDGLTNMIPESEIYEIIKENPEKANEALVSKANEYGGFDNVTVIIIENN